MPVGGEQQFGPELAERFAVPYFLARASSG